MKDVWVEFIGSGYEVVEMLKVSAYSFSDAFRKAESWYQEAKPNFKYMEMEISHWTPDNIFDH